MKLQQTLVAKRPPRLESFYGPCPEGPWGGRPTPPNFEDAAPCGVGAAGRVGSSGSGDAAVAGGPGGGSSCASRGDASIPGSGGADRGAAPGGRVPEGGPARCRDQPPGCGGLGGEVDRGIPGTPPGMGLGGAEPVGRALGGDADHVSLAAPSPPGTPRVPVPLKPEDSVCVVRRVSPRLVSEPGGRAGRRGGGVCVRVLLRSLRVGDPARPHCDRRSRAATRAAESSAVSMSEAEATGWYAVEWDARVGESASGGGEARRPAPGGQRQRGGGLSTGGCGVTGCRGGMRGFGTSCDRCGRGLRDKEGRTPSKAMLPSAKQSRAKRDGVRRSEGWATTRTSESITGHGVQGQGCIGREGAFAFSSPGR